MVVERWWVLKENEEGVSGRQWKFDWNEGVGFRGGVVEKTGSGRPLA